MMAQVCGLKPGVFVHTIGDAHLYNNHLEQAKLQVTREPLPLPNLKLNSDIKGIDDFGFDDIEVLNYQHHPHISAPISI
jgi:thymidylate synthase